jgi:hypothetical protein
VQITNIFINKSSNQEYLLEILGKFTSTFLNTNLLLTIFLEFSTLSKLNNKIDIKTGKYDNYMWQIILLSSLIASILGINRYEQLELTYVLFNLLRSIENSKVELISNIVLYYLLFKEIDILLFYLIQDLDII